MLCDGEARSYVMLRRGSDGVAWLPCRLEELARDYDGAVSALLGFVGVAFGSAAHWALLREVSELSRANLSE